MFYLPVDFSCPTIFGEDIESSEKHSKQFWLFDLFSDMTTKIFNGLDCPPEPWMKQNAWASRVLHHPGLPQAFQED